MNSEYSCSMFSFNFVQYISVGWRWTIKKWNPDAYEQWEKDEMAWRKFLINGAFDARGLPIYQMTSRGLSNGMYLNVVLTTSILVFTIPTIIIQS